GAAGGKAAGARAGRAGGGGGARPGARRVALRHVEDERAPFAGGALLELELAPEQPRDLAADGQAEAGAAVLAAGAAHGLLEGLEDDLLLLRGNADAGVGHLERDHRPRPVEDRLVGAPASGRGSDAQGRRALLRELEGVGEEVLQDLLQALGVGLDR